LTLIFINFIFLVYNLSDNQYIVTARKWRPQRFDTVVGQEHITTTLRNSIISGRVHQAYLFCGPRGVGKTTTARIYAKALNCLAPINNEPCGECSSCISILNGQSIDVIEIDGASNNSVDDVRKLKDSAKYPPAVGKYKLYIIDEVHMLSTSAFNALLKTLEEPPPHLVFIFATTESHKVPATIISRCQRFDFRRMELSSITSQLSLIAKTDGIKIDEMSLNLIAKKGDGSMRDAQSIFDQAVAFCGEDIQYKELAEALSLIDEEFYFKISDAVLNKSTAEMFNLTNEIIIRGYDLLECLRGTIEHFRNLLYIAATNDLSSGDYSMETKQKLLKDSAKFDQIDVLRIINILVIAEKDLRSSSQPRIRFEIALANIANIVNTLDIINITSAIEEVKKNFSSVDTNSEISDNKKEVEEPKSYYVNSVNQSPVEEEINETEDESNINIKESPIDLASGWEEFLAKYGTPEHHLTMLGQAKAKFVNDEILIYTQIEFAMKNLMDHSKELRAFLKEFYKRDVKIKIILDENLSNETSEKLTDINAVQLKKMLDNTLNKSNSSNSSNESNNIDLSNLNPIEAILIKDFGAKEIS